jgi:hypothetical protein
MSDREMQDYLDGIRAEWPAGDQESLALYRAVYEVLEQELPESLPGSFAQAVSDRLFAPAKAQARREPALEWLLPLLGLMPIVVFAALQTIPRWLDRAADAFRSPQADAAMPDLLTLACLLAGILMIGFFDSLLTRIRRSRAFA